MAEHQRLLVRQLKGHKDTVRKVCTTPDGKYVVSVSSDMTVRITQTKDGKLFREIKMNSTNDHVCVTICKTTLIITSGANSSGCLKDHLKKFTSVISM